MEEYLKQAFLPYTVFQPLYIYGPHTAKDCEQVGTRVGRLGTRAAPDAAAAAPRPPAPAALPAAHPRPAAHRLYSARHCVDPAFSHCPSILFTHPTPQWFMDRILRDRPVPIPAPGVQLTSLSHVRRARCCERRDRAAAAACHWPAAVPDVNAGMPVRCPTA